MMTLRKKTASRLEEAKKQFLLPNVDDGERQPAWADLLHGDNVACNPTDPSNVLEDRVHQLETQVIWNESKHTRLFLAVQIRVH